jgi:hypothetical protein
VRDLSPSDEEVHQWQRDLNVYLASEWRAEPSEALVGDTSDHSLN